MGSVPTLIEGLLAFGLVAAVMIALADTRLYPLALGIMVIALFYVLIGHPAAVSSLQSLIHGSAGKLGPAKGN
jgi:hypothetical protein